MSTRLACGVATAVISFACTPAATTAAPVSAPRVESGYLTIAPDVSVSRSAQPVIAKNAVVDDRSDVMAEILAIPPGR